jgi:hypothetical protein
LPGILAADSPRLRQQIKLRFLLIIVTGKQRPHGARPRRENHSSPEIPAAIRGVERRDQTTDKAVNESNEGHRPSQQGHVNEQMSDGEQKV